MNQAIRRRRWTPLAIFAMIVGFILWWPLGLAVIGYILWGGSVDQLADDLAAKVCEAWRPKQPSHSGNAAFDDYRAQTLKRLEDEQAEFAGFVRKLREARDREEFDRFMGQRNIT